MKIYLCNMVDENSVLFTRKYFFFKKRLFKENNFSDVQDSILHFLLKVKNRNHSIMWNVKLVISS